MLTQLSFNPSLHRPVLLFAEVPGESARRDQGHVVELNLSRHRRQATEQSHQAVVIRIAQVKYSIAIK